MNQLDVQHLPSMKLCGKLNILVLIMSLFRLNFAVKGMFESNSFGKVEFAGDIEGNNEWDIFGPFTIPWKLKDHSGNEGCQPAVWADMADHVAREAGFANNILLILIGVRFENYQHRVYVLPSATSRK
jgi:hypothetical protein